MRFVIIVSIVVSAFITAVRADEERDKILPQLNNVDPPKVPKIDPTVTATLKIPEMPAVVGQPYELTLTATNKGKVKVVVPVNYKSAQGEWVWDGVGICVSPSAAIQRTSIFTNLPTFDYILPGETKTFRLTWTPLELHTGSRELSLFLPNEFESVAPAKVTVNTHNGMTDRKSKEGEAAQSNGDKPSN